MKAVILAGGEGTRLRPVTENRAKPFVMIDGKPCIEHVIGALVRDGFNDLLMTMYYKPLDIIKHLGSGINWGANITYSIEDTPLGTFGGVRKNAGFLRETFVVASGDVLADVDFKEIYDYHKEKNAIATIALTTADNPTEYGIVGLNESGRIERFKEKPRKEEVFSNLINAGIYVLEPDVFRYFPLNTNVDFSKDLFPVLLKAHKPLYGKRVSGLWIDIGRPSDLINAHLQVFTKRLGSNIRVSSSCMEGVRMEGRCFIGDDVVIGKNVYLEDAYVSDGCRIGEGVKIVDTVVSPDTIVGRGTDITASFICQDCKIGREVFLKNAVLGENVTVTDGKKIVDEKVMTARAI